MQKDRNISADCLEREIPCLILWMESGLKLMEAQLISAETRFHSNSFLIISVWSL